MCLIRFPKFNGLVVPDDSVEAGLGFKSRDGPILSSILLKADCSYWSQILLHVPKIRLNTTIRSYYNKRKTGPSSLAG